MIKKVLNLLYTDTGRDTSIVTIGTLINILAGGVFFILSPRILGPSDYGLFSTIIATGLMAVGIANFGIDTGILRFTGEESQLDKILSFAFKLYVSLGILIGILGVLLSPFIADLLNQPNITNLLRIAFASTIFLLLTNFFVAGLQAKKEFSKASIVNISSNVARLLIVVFAMYFFSVSLYFLTILFFFVTVVSIIFGVFFLPFKFEKIQKPLALNFMKYNFWIASSLIISSIPFDNYFLLKFAGPIQTGLYAAPFKILTFVYQFGGNFSRVLASRFASFDTNEKAKKFAVKSIPFVILFIIGLIFLYVVSSPVINLLFGKNYQGSINIMRILLIGFIFFFASTIPASVIIYYFGKSQVSFTVTVIKYLIFILFLFILVPMKKASGAALAFSFSEFFSFLLMTLYVIQKLEKKYES